MEGFPKQTMHVAISLPTNALSELRWHVYQTISCSMWVIMDIKLPPPSPHTHKNKREKEALNFVELEEICLSGLVLPVHHVPTTTHPPLKKLPNS